MTMMDGIIVQEVENINAYLVPGPNVIVRQRSDSRMSSIAEMVLGNMPTDGGHLLS